MEIIFAVCMIDFPCRHQFNFFFFHTGVASIKSKGMLKVRHVARPVNMKLKDRKQHFLSQ